MQELLLALAVRIFDYVYIVFGHSLCFFSQILLKKSMPKFTVAAAEEQGKIISVTVVLHERRTLPVPTADYQGFAF